MVPSIKDREMTGPGDRWWEAVKKGPEVAWNQRFRSKAEREGSVKVYKMVFGRVECPFSIYSGV